MTSNDDKYLLHLIQGYWDATLTDDQECELIHRLADPTLKETHEIAQARAVLGVSAAMRVQVRKAARRRRARFAQAASIALIIGSVGAAVGLTGDVMEQSQPDIAIACVDGRTITDSEEVLSMVRQNLSMISNTNRSAIKPLEAIGAMLGEPAAESTPDSVIM